MDNSRKFLGLLAALVLPFAVNAADDQPLEAPPLPPPLQTGEPLEPEVTIRQTPRETVYEYRRNGQLILVRVQPRVGPPYHFVDVDGDGSLDYRPGEPVTHGVNQWLLFQW
jgi:hypothetical protein